MIFIVQKGGAVALRSSARLLVRRSRVRFPLWPPAPYRLGRCLYNVTGWSPSSVSCVAARKIVRRSCLGARPRYNLVVDEDVKKPNNQPNYCPEKGTFAWHEKKNKSIKLRYRLHVHIIDAHTHTFHTINTFRLNAFHSVRIPEGTNDFLYLSFLHVWDKVTLSEKHKGLYKLELSSRSRVTSYIIWGNASDTKHTSVFW